MAVSLYIASGARMAACEVDPERVSYSLHFVQGQVGIKARGLESV